MTICGMSERKREKLPINIKEIHFQLENHTIFVPL
jgi:hypothetical protein